MAIQFDHNRGAINESLKVNEEDFEWVKDLYVEYTDGKYKFSEIIEKIIQHVRKEEFDDDGREVSRYEVKLLVASYFWGSYHSLFNLFLKGLNDPNTGKEYKKLFDGIFGSDDYLSKNDD